MVQPKYSIDSNVMWRVCFAFWIDKSTGTPTINIIDNQLDATIMVY